MDAKPFSKESQLARGPRRYRRKVASPKQWAAIREAKLYGQPCRVCDGERQKLHVYTLTTSLHVYTLTTSLHVYTLTTSLHHLVPRSMGGDDVADNLVATHNVCHDAVHQRRPAAIQKLALSLTDAEYAYCVGKLGEGAMTRLFGV